MKNIKKIIFIALLAIFAAACTNEEDFNTNSSGTTFNKKNAIQGDNKRPYPEYEMKDYSDAETKAMLVNFDNVVNDPSSTISDMPIEKALYIMETYINYGVIDKANSVATEPNTEDRTFTFTTPIESGNVIGTELKGKFQDFAVNLLTTMRGKALSLSDMYVVDISSTSVTFGLDILPVPPHPDYFRYPYYFPEFYGANDAISVPSGIASPWGQWYVDGRTQWNESWTEGGSVIEHNVYQYSQKPIRERYDFGRSSYFTYYTHLRHVYYDNSEYEGRAYQINYDDLSDNIVTPPTTVYYDAEGIANVLIPPVLALFPDLYEMSNARGALGNRTLCDYIPSLSHGIYQPVDDGSIHKKAFFLYVSKATYGFKHREQPIMRYAAALSIADVVDINPRIPVQI